MVFAKQIAQMARRLRWRWGQICLSILTFLPVAFGGDSLGGHGTIPNGTPPIMTTPVYSYSGGAGGFTNSINTRTFSAFWQATAPPTEGTVVLDFGGGAVQVRVENGYYTIHTVIVIAANDRSMLKVPTGAHIAGLVATAAGVTFYVGGKIYSLIGNVFGNDTYALPNTNYTANTHSTANMAMFDVYDVALSSAEARGIANPAGGAYAVFVFDGNSLTVDVSTLSWPSQFLSGIIGNFVAYNIAVGGQDTDTMIDRAPPLLYPLYDAAAISNTVFALEGTNQMGNCNAIAAYSRFLTYAGGVTIRNFRLLVGTIPPQNAFSQACFETARQQYNALVRSNYRTFANGLFDIGTNAVIGQAGEWANTTYYQADQIHFTEAGNAVVAGLATQAALNQTQTASLSSSSTGASGSYSGGKSMSCGNCGQNTSETTVEAYIQPCAGEQSLFSNVIDGDYPAITFSNLKPARKGKKTKKRKKDSRTGNWVVCYTSTDAPGDATVDLEVAACGCGGYAPRELEDQIFNAYLKYFCCGDLVRTQVITNIDLTDPSTDKLNDFDAALEQKVSYSGALFDEEYDLYPLSFSEVAASSGLATGAQITDVAYIAASTGCGTACGKGCQDGYVAITDDGHVIYKAGANSAQASVAIPGWVSTLGIPKIVAFKNKIYTSFSSAIGYGYFYATLDSAGNPGAWTQVVLGNGSIVDTMMIDGTHVTMLVHNTTTSLASAVTIVSGGQYSVASAYTSGIIGMDVCGSNAIGSTGVGTVLTRSCGNAWTPTAVAPSIVPIFAVAFQSEDTYWIGDTAGVIKKSTDGGYTWTTVPMPSASTFIGDIRWVNALTGYIAAATPAKLFATVDGGATWEDADDRIAGAIANGGFLRKLAIPCCDNSTTSNNNLLVSGITAGGVGAIWQGQKQSC